jgi:hypothetical protein
MMTNKMQLFFICLFLVCSTCFGRLFRPSSGAHNCIYSFRYFPPLLLLAGSENSYILLVVNYNYTSDARTHDSETKRSHVKWIRVYLRVRWIITCILIIWTFHNRVKGKANPIQAWTGPQDSSRLSRHI